MMECGALLRERIYSLSESGANSKHYIDTALFRCLLLTVGLHVLSQTGHTDVIESFRFRMNYSLHTSGILKYRELALFYAFL